MSPIIRTPFGKPMNRWDWIAGLGIFILPLAMEIMVIFSTNGIILPVWVILAVRYVILSCVIIGLIYALLRGIPRWSFPYLGYLLSISILFLLNSGFLFWIYQIYKRMFGDGLTWSVPVNIVYGGIFTVILNANILLFALGAVTLLQRLPLTRGLWDRIRADWTQLSYLLFGSTIFVLLFTFDEYHHDEVLKLIFGSVLAVSAWFYLKATTRRGRIRILLTGVTIVMLGTAVAKYWLVPLQQWTVGYEYPVSPSMETRWNETGGAVIQWISMVLLLLSPALLNYLPGKPAQNNPGSEELVST